MSGSTRIRDIEACFRIETIRDAGDALDLRYGVHYKGKGEPQRYVAFLNGRTEWLEKYCYLAEDLEVREGTAFLTWDHRGQGASGGARAYVDTYDSYGRDAQRIVAHACGKKPYVVVSHSMGGLIALYATLKGFLAPKALVLSSPLLGMPNDPVPRALAKPLARLLTLGMLGSVSTGGGGYTDIPFAANKLTHSEELYARMQQSPYPVPGATFGWVTATFAAIAACFSPEELKKLSAPTLVLGGTQERVVDPLAFEAWARLAARHAPADVSLRLITGAKHELLSEVPDYYRPALEAISAFLRPYLL